MITVKSRIEVPRSVYSYTIHANIIAIIDHDQGRTVTNDIGNVIDDLTRKGFDLSKYHVIIRIRAASGMKC